MYTRTFIRRPGLLTITGQDGAVYRGADQDWYPEQIQRWSGCGPTAAALILSYLAARPGLEALWPERSMEQATFTRYMCQVWQYVTPRAHGLHQPGMFRDGVQALAAGRGLDITPRVLEIPAARTRRPDFEQAARFIRAGLEADCPVAFLNLSNGKVSQLDRWHWVTIIGMDGPMAHILDSGREFPIDLSLWYETTKKRGGFVSILSTLPAGEGQPV